MKAADLAKMIEEQGKIIAALQAQIATGAGAAKPEAKKYQAGIVLEGEECKVPKGHVALIVPLLETPKALRNGKDHYIAETRGSALHAKTGEGYDFNAYIIKRNPGHKI